MRKVLGLDIGITTAKKMVPGTARILSNVLI
jgi:hypothetical protein